MSLKPYVLAVTSVAILISTSSCQTPAKVTQNTIPESKPVSHSFLNRIQEHLGDKLTPRDIQRLTNWGVALIDGEYSAKHAGQADELERRSPLFRQNARIPGDIPAGLYNCSITKLGTTERSLGSSYVAYPAFKCLVKDDGERKHFTKLTGSQLTTGWIYPISNDQYAYMGTSFYGYEDKAVPYGQSEERDNVAIVEKIGDERWRMVFPYPYYESSVDVMELTPIKE